MTGLKLPHMDSLKLAEDLRIGPRPTPILVIAGSLPSDLRSHFGELDATHFMEKPFQLSALRTAVQQAIRNSAGASAIIPRTQSPRA